MVKKTNTTKSTKRYVYSSFRDRIEDLKINRPLLKTSNRDLEVEVSNFHERYEHWKEINITGNFTEFINNNETLWQTLPQLIYHRDKIYNELISHLTKEDNIELTFEPLLDLLAQFVHDLGEDFYEPYFSKTVTTLEQLAILHFDNSNILEWIFNCLGFIFKYLASILSKNLIETFKLLLPLFQYTKTKTYLSRFASEALSFLIKKIPLKTSGEFVRQTIDILNENNLLGDSLIIMYSEAMTNVNGTLHSKSQQLLNTLLAFESSSPCANALISDIILNLLGHATVDSSKVVYETVLEHISNKIESHRDLKPLVQLLITLSFAQSGKKVSDWNLYITIVERCLEQNSGDDIATNNSIVQLAAIMMRNCDMQELTKYHVKLFQHMISLNNGKHFLPFVEASLDLTRERTVSFGSKYIQDYINSSWVDSPMEIALFLSHLSTKNFKIALVIPFTFYKSVQEYLSHIKSIKDENSLKNLYWRLQILKHATDLGNADDLTRILKLLISSKFIKNPFCQDLVGLVLEFLSLQKSETQDLVMNIMLDNFEILQNSTPFLKGVLAFIKSSNDSQVLTEKLDSFLTSVSTNISSSSHDSRYISLSIVIASLTATSNEVPSLISQCHLIEDIPLTLQTARDIQLRVRKLGDEYSKNSVNSLVAQVVPRFLFGLLTVKFMPSWEASYDAMKLISGKADEKIWDLAYDFIVKDYSLEEVEQEYTSTDESIDIESSNNAEWLVKDQRLNDNTATVYKQIESYYHPDFSIIQFAQSSRGDMSFRRVMRTQSLTALTKISEIAEAHSQSLVPLLLNEDLDSEEVIEGTETSINSASWSLSERNLLLSLFEKFKNMKRIYKSEQVYDHMLMLLSSRQNLIQKSALNCIFSFKNSHINKYRDNFSNLLDDTLFRDELSKFVASDSTVNIIEDQDRDEAMRLVLRILYGRSQVPKTSGMSKGRKFAVVSVLPSLPVQYVIEFLKLGTDKISFQGFFKSLSLDPVQITERLLRREVGFVNLLSDVIGILGSAFNNVLATIIEPLIYALSTAQYSFKHELELSSVALEKAARIVRSIGMRCLNELFQNLKNSYDWSQHIDIIYEHVISPRFENFAEENLQQPSSLLRILVGWSTSKEYQQFLFIDNFRPLQELLSLLSNSNAKEPVLSMVFDFCLAIVNTTSLDEKFIEVVSIVVESCLNSLSGILDRVANKDVNSKAVTLLLSLSENGYIEDYDTKKSLIASLVNAFDKPSSQVENKDKINILKSLASIVENFDCSLEDVIPLYEACSKSFKNYSDKKIRQSMCGVFINISARFTELEPIGKYVDDLNSFSNKRMDEPDFERRLSAFKEINESTYEDLDDLSWLPLIYCALYFMNDKDELAIRTNATYMLCRYVDCFSSKESLEEASPYIQLLKDIILPLLRMGLRSVVEEVQSEYISLLSHIVSSSKHYHDLDDMKVLLFDGDDEANFFSNVNHIQIHRRQRAIRRLRQLQDGLSDGSISHYIIPMVENYAFSEDEKLRNVANDSIETIGYLSCSMSWNQFRALFKRYISYLSSSKKPLRDSVNLVVSVANSFSAHLRGEEEKLVEQQKLPSKKTDIENFITNEVLPPLIKVLAKRDDETVVQRIPISEALTSLVICLDPEVTANELPGILTTVCQVMRSRSEELRDAVRKNLGKMALILGPTYFKFILQELKTALKRGSQIHVLSFTIHYLLVIMSESLKHGDLDESVQLLVDIVMEDAFGAAGQEKDAEGYTNKMKEVKHNKSFDTAELLAARVSLESFTYLINPIKLLLTERIALKTQNKLDELLRRYALGLNHNQDSSTREILILCYQLHEQSKDMIYKGQNQAPKKPKNQAADHFLVKLDARSQKTQNEYSLYLHTLQKFSLELLRVAISRNESLATTSNLEGFVPLLEESLHTENEGVIIAAIRVLNLIVRLPFSESIDNIFKTCARKTLNIIKDSPSTTSELSQACLKFLATVIRHKSDIKLKETALSYILTRIQPDLQEPNKQGLAFNFLKALVSSHVMIAEVYETMDKVAEIMITNHAKEIRDMSRSVYYQFLMEYDQSRGRLEKQFKFLVNNLQYPAEKGRQSVMELLHLIINRAGSELLSKLSSSFFVSLTMVMISDDSNRCREMAVVLISAIFKKQSEVEDIEKYVFAWLSQRDNSLLLRCGLQSYKLYVTERGLQKNKELDLLAMKKIMYILELAKKAEEGEDIEWELVYSALTVLGLVASNMGEEIYQSNYKTLWLNITDSLLYPHSWVRLAASRLIGNYILKLDGLKLSNYTVQTIAYRLLRQLAAPGVSEALGTQIVKNMAKITMYWKSNKTPYTDASEVEDDKNFKLAMHWAISRTSAIMRNEIGDDLKMNKKCSIQYTALVIQIMSAEEILDVAETMILPLYNFSESNNEQDEELKNMALETLDMLETKLGVSDYTLKFSKVRQRVIERRQERKAKRSQLAISAPELSAKRKMRKHERFREKRKHEKDENGYYKEKRKKIDRMRN